MTESSWVGNPGNFMRARIETLFSRGLVGSRVNLEKAIFALEYVAQLQDTGLDFVFKGGSAVQILLGDRWNRLSIDVDICTDASEEELVEALEAIKRRFSGRDFTFSARGDSILGPVPFYSFRVMSPPITERGRVILLDAMGFKPRFATRTTPLRSFYYDSAVDVTTPTLGSILGDKFTTIGPNTVGRAMRDSRNGVEYAKHLFTTLLIRHVRNHRLGPKHLDEASNLLAAPMEKRPEASAPGWHPHYFRKPTNAFLSNLLRWYIGFLLLSNGLNHTIG